MQKNNTNHEFVTTIDNLDQAAVLSAMGFPLRGREVIEAHNLDSQSSPSQPSCCIWEFGLVSATGQTLESFQREWVRGLPAGRIPQPLPPVAFARLALHNYRVLRQVGKQSTKLWQLDMLAAGRVGNFPQSADWQQVPLAHMATPGCTCSEAEAAVLVALGYKIAAATSYAGRCFSECSNEIGRPDVATLLAQFRSAEWVEDPRNFDPAAVALCALRSRAALLRPEATTLLVSKGSERALLMKNASDAALRTVAQHLNS